MVTVKRPVGVTILAILAIIGGVLGLIGGFGLILLGLAAGAVLASSSGGVVTGAAAVLVGLVLLVGAVLDLAFAVGAFRAAGWAWVLGIAAEVLSLIVSLIEIIAGAAHGQLGSEIASNIVGIVIAVFILWYLNRPDVRAYFGRA